MPALTTTDPDPDGNIPSGIGAGGPFDVAVIILLGIFAVGAVRWGAVQLATVHGWIVSAAALKLWTAVAWLTARNG